MTTDNIHYLLVNPCDLGTINISRCILATEIFKKIKFKMKKSKDIEIMIFLSLIQTYLRDGMSIPFDKLKQLSFLKISNTTISKINKLSIMIVESSNNFIPLQFTYRFSNILKYQKMYLRLPDSMCYHLKSLYKIINSPKKPTLKNSLINNLHIYKFYNNSKMFRIKTKSDKLLKVSILFMTECNVLKKSQIFGYDKIETVSEATGISTIKLQYCLSNIQRYLKKKHSIIKLMF